MPLGELELQAVADAWRPLEVDTSSSGGEAAVPVTIDVTGGRVLRLVVSDGGDGNKHDHADWADATLAR